MKNLKDALEWKASKPKKKNWMINEILRINRIIKREIKEANEKH